MARAQQDRFSDRRGGRHRRADDFPVRRWLQVGAASAGMGAALLGFSLLGPQVGVAAADTSGESSVSSSPSDSADSAGPSAPGSSTVTDDDATETSGDASADPETDDPKIDPEIDDPEIDDPEIDDPEIEDVGATAEVTEDADRAGDDRAGSGDGDDDTADDPERNAPADPAPQPSRVADYSDSPVSQQVATASLQTTDVAGAVAAPQNSWDRFVATAIANWTASTQAWIASLNVSDERKASMEASFLAMRRTFFNQAPTVAPVQISGRLTGPITGTVGATDADGDRLIYRLSRAPREGTVQLNPDGSYTYTPDADFDGVDTFRVVAIDAGLHVNLLDPFRGLGTRANSLINQGAIRFDFAFNTGAQYWTPDRREALSQAADELLLYFLVTSPVVLTYNVTGMEDAASDTLASAGSSLISTTAGFVRTVVQHKLLTGVDANGSAADGRITWNFGSKWALGEVVGADEFDFASTAMHELLHSFGFLSYLGEAGNNPETTRPVFDRFVRNVDGRSPIDWRYRWITEYDPILTGGDGGMFFGGEHAVAAYGGLVPLYTPDPWEEGSSGSHLDDATFTGSDQMMMNARTGTGPGVRVLSAIEVGILRDLGYQISVPQSPSYAMAFVGFALLVRKRRPRSAAR